MTDSHWFQSWMFNSKNMFNIKYFVISIKMNFISPANSRIYIKRRGMPWRNKRKTIKFSGLNDRPRQDSILYLNKVYILRWYTCRNEWKMDPKLANKFDVTFFKV